MCFLAINELPNGTAEAVEKAVTGCLDHKNIPIARMVAFGSDGAFVMTGKHNGVSACLKHTNLWHSLCCTSVSTGC